MWKKFTNCKFLYIYTISCLYLCHNNFLFIYISVKFWNLGGMLRSKNLHPPPFFLVSDDIYNSYEQVVCFYVNCTNFITEFFVVEFQWRV